MLDPSKLAKPVLEALHERGHTDKMIAQLSEADAFEEYCQWHGFLGWAPSILNAIDSIRGASK